MNIFESASLKLFLKTYGLLFLIAACTLFFIEKGDMVLFLNSIHNPTLDFFFKYMTHFGDGLLLIGLLLITFFVSKYHSLLIVLMASLQGILTYLLKKVIFKNTPRPKSYFDQEVFDSLNLVDGVHVHSMNSFPSGHTLTAFSFAIFICILAPRRWVAIFALLLAVLAGISRVYLVQHFFIDITFGSLVGVLIGLSSHWLLRRKINLELQQNVLSQPLIKWFQ